MLRKRTDEPKDGEKTVKRLPAETDLLLATFGLEKKFGGSLLTEMMTAPGVLSEFHETLLKEVHQKSLLPMSGWNEEELKMKMLSFLFFIADIEEPGRISTFYERVVAATIGNHKISVKADCLIAAPLGLTTPKEPYFFLQEFKRMKPDSDDPEGQMLAGMIAARHLNPSKYPMYGAWLTGNNWFFTTLQGQDYCTTNALDTTDLADLRQIVFALRKMKDVILSRN